ncbi:MAG TPA: histidinol phosphatase [Candidatus Rokubacteria bacterium]|nr:histidinol phosphatase [Candidatus Rokubacteria bacterium]
MKPFSLPRWRFMNCCGHVWGHRPPPQASGEAANGASRRDFVKTAASGVAGLAALATLPKQVAAQVRVFPPPPPAVSPIEGLIDFHNHCAPDVFGRAVDDDEMAQLYLARKLEAVVLKNHVALTADRAWLVRKHNPGIKAFGGVTLNAAAGGINPDAVQWMWRMQGGYGRVVWLPTFDADNHVKHFKDAPEGIKVVGADGKVLPAVREVLKICAQQKLVLCTGHASPTEVLALVEAARDAGCDRIVVTHAEFEVVNMSVDQMKKAAAMGAKMEIDAMGSLMGPSAHLGWMRHWRLVTHKESAEHVKGVGAEHFVLGTDLGQTGNPSQSDGYQMLVAGLVANGITKEQIKIMGREVPGKLLMG